MVELRHAFRFVCKSAAYLLCIVRSYERCVLCAVCHGNVFFVYGFFYDFLYGVQSVKFAVALFLRNTFEEILPRIVRHFHAVFFKVAFCNFFRFGTVKWRKRQSLDIRHVFERVFHATEHVLVNKRHSEHDDVIFACLLHVFEQLFEVFGVGLVNPLAYIEAYHASLVVFDFSDDVACVVQIVFGLVRHLDFVFFDGCDRRHFGKRQIVYGKRKYFKICCQSASVTDREEIALGHKHVLRIVFDHFGCNRHKFFYKAFEFLRADKRVDKLECVVNCVRILRIVAFVGIFVF